MSKKQLSVVSVQCSGSLIRAFSPLLVIITFLIATTSAQPPDRNEYGNPPPQIFESEDRDEWQRPEFVIERLDIKESEIVADLGAGSGYFTRRFSAAVGPSGHVLALDVDPAMLEHIARDVPTRGLSVDTTRVPFDSPGIAVGSVDRLFISNTLHHIQDRAPYHPRLIDALRPGGRIAIVDFFKRPLPVGPQSVDHKLAKSSVIREFTEAGLQSVQDIEGLPHQYFLVARPFPAFLNARLLSQDLATGGQPTPEDLTRLHDLGYRTILNLRRPDEGSNEEGDRVRELGMTYLNISIGGQPTIPQEVDKFTAVLTDSANYPMLMHCASANRVGGLFYLTVSSTKTTTRPGPWPTHDRSASNPASRPL